MANHFLPTLTSLYTDFLSLFSARVDDAMKQNRSDTVTLTNPPTGAVRWNVAGAAWEHNTGTPASPVWSTLASAYNIVAANATKWSTPRTISLSGDGTGTSGGFDGTGNLSFAMTLATVNSNVGTFGGAAAVPILTVNGKGLITAVNTAALGSMATQAAGSVAITGGAVSGTDITLKQSTTAAPTAEGRMEWDTDNDQLMVGGSGVTRVISPDNITATLSAKTFADSIKRTAAGVGHLEGSYPTVESGATAGAVYSIGGAYQPGTTTLGNMYGVGYTLSNVSGISVAGMSGGPYWGLYVAAGGTARVFLDGSNGIGWFHGAVYSGGIQCVYNSGTWGISITGNAATATTATSATSATTATYAPNSSKLYSTDAAYQYGGAGPYYGYLTYMPGPSRWRFQVSPASPAAVEVAYADTAGSAPASDVYAWAKASVRPTYTAADVGAVAALGYMQVQDQKTSGTNGGSASAGSNTRTLNTVVSNSISGASLSADTVSLPAGTYEVSGWSSYGTWTGGPTVREAVYISTGALIVGAGTLGYSGGSWEGLSVSGRFTLASAGSINLRTYFSTAQSTYGLGFATSNGIAEVYSNLEIWKIA